MTMLNLTRVRTVTSRAAVLGTAIAAASLAAALSGAGCSTYVPGGSGFSDDAFTYASTEHVPQSVALIDTRTGQTIWTYEIPVGRQLTVRFEKNINPDNVLTPDEMYWEEMDAGTHHGYLDNSILVPGHNARRIDVITRPAPEIPTAAATTPSQGQ